MTTLTNFPSNKNLSLLDKHFEFFRQYGYDDLNFGALYKWAVIINHFHNCFPETKDLRILDIGGGLGPLDQYFSNYGKVVSIDIRNDRSTWFPVGEKGFYKNGKKFNFDNTNLERISGNFFDSPELFDKHSFDFIYDSCSMIHFSDYGKSENTFNSLHKVCCIVESLLKQNGYFVTCSDVAHPNSFQFRDMIYAENFAMSIMSSGLEPKYPLDFSFENITEAKKNLNLPNYQSAGLSSVNDPLGLLVHTYSNGRAAMTITVFQSCFTKKPSNYKKLDTFSKSDFKRESWRNKLTKIFGFLRVGFRRYFSSAHD